MSEIKPDLANLEVAQMPPEKAIEELSDIAVRILIGAEVYEGHHFNPKLMRITLGGLEEIVHKEDFNIAKWVADKVFREHIQAKNLNLMVQSVPYILKMRSIIHNILADYYENKDDHVRVVFLRGDNMGCGFWRVKLPGEYLRDQENKISVQISDVAIDYDQLVKYDVIVVQRVFDYEQYYILSTLKSVGKKIIYEVDDDIFNVEPHNPCANIYNRYDSQLCMRHCLALADKVIVTTERLAKALDIEDKAIIYPNSLDWDKLFYVNKKKEERKRHRIFWSGSNTHNEDFKVCMPALLRIFKEREDVELFILGMVPPIVQHLLGEYANRVISNSGMHTEAYFQYLRFSLDADIGIVPLEDTVFNHSKSICKGLEYTLARIPIVASGCPPYSDVFEHGKDALLCSTEEDWYESINSLLENKEMREEMVKNARKKAVERFHLRKNADYLCDEISQLGSSLVNDRIERRSQSRIDPQAEQLV